MAGRIAERRQMVRSVCRHAPSTAPAGLGPAYPGQPAWVVHIAVRRPGFAHILPLPVRFSFLLWTSPVHAASRDFPGADNPLSEQRFTSVGVAVMDSQLRVIGAVWRAAANAAGRRLR